MRARLMRLADDTAWVRRAFVDHGHLVRTKVEAAHSLEPTLAVGTADVAVTHGV
jgi:hypothetical protein